MEPNNALVDFNVNDLIAMPRWKRCAAIIHMNTVLMEIAEYEKKRVLECLKNLNTLMVNDARCDDHGLLRLELLASSTSPPFRIHRYGKYLAVEISHIQHVVRDIAGLSDWLQTDLQDVKMVWKAFQDE